MTPPTLQRVGVVTEMHQQSDSTAVMPSSNMFVGLTRQEREAAITGLVEQGGIALREAARAGEPADVMASYKDQAAAIADLSKRIDVSKDAVLDAQVLQRRAERGLGVAIRQGQEDGTIETPAEAAQRGARVRNESHGWGDGLANGKTIKPKPTDFASPSELSRSDRGIYALADNGTDDDFEIAVTEAREEGNVSRANVVRKLTEQQENRVTEAVEMPNGEDRVAYLESLSAKYPTSRLAFEAEAHERYASAESLHDATRRAGVKFRFNERTYAKHVAQSQDWLDRSSAHIDTAIGVLSHIDFSTITPEQAEEALQRIDLRQLKKYITALEGITNG